MPPGTFNQKQLYISNKLLQKCPSLSSTPSGIKNLEGLPPVEKRGKILHVEQIRIAQIKGSFLIYITLISNFVPASGAATDVA